MPAASEGRPVRGVTLGGIARRSRESLHRSQADPQRAAVLVESAIIYPAVFLLLLGLAVGGAGIFRYQEVASLAREAARYASTHGANSRNDAGLPVGDATAWTSDIYTNAI